MRCVERFARGKDPRIPCEDATFFDGRFAAVIDGATAKAPVPEGRPSPGAAIAAFLAEAMHGLAEDWSGAQAIAHLSGAVLDWRRAAFPDGEAPSASIAILSAARREFWILGDCRVSVGGNAFDTERPLDRAAADFRAAVLAVELASGRTVDELRADDPGRAAIMPLLSRQRLLRNAPPATPFAYGALDGDPAAAAHLRTIPVWYDGEVVLATDGYPDSSDTLAEAEAHLARLIALDPLMASLHRSTKGVAPGAESYDDRAFLRIAWD